MKTLKAICPAAVLVFALGVSAFAGDIQTPGSPAPVPPARVTSSPATDTVVTAEYSACGDASATSFAEILWALTSIF